MSSPSSLPAYLRERMDQLGITSLRGLARRIDISPETARRLLAGTVQPDEATLRKVSERLPAPLLVLRRMAGRPSGERLPFVLPPEADQLDERQRAVILSMVSVLLDAATSTAHGPDRAWPRLVGRPREPDSNPSDGPSLGHSE